MSENYQLAQNMSKKAQVDLNIRREGEMGSEYEEILQRLEKLITENCVLLQKITHLESDVAKETQNLEEQSRLSKDRCNPLDIENKNIKMHNEELSKEKDTLLIENKKCSEELKLNRALFDKLIIKLEDIKRKTKYF